MEFMRSSIFFGDLTTSYMLLWVNDQTAGEDRSTYKRATARPTASPLKIPYPKQLLTLTGSSLVAISLRTVLN